MSADLDNDLLVLLYDVARHMRLCADDMAESLGLTRAQLIILVRLDWRPNLSQNELAVLAEVTPMTIARLIDRLEAVGLVERCPDPQDRRIWRLRLTPGAKPVLSEIGRLRAALRDVMVKDIDPAVLDAMAGGLKQMKENVGRHQRLAKTAAERGSPCP